MRSAASSASNARGLRARLRNPVAQFTVAAVAAVAAVGVVAAFLLNRAADEEAIHDAKRVTELAGEGIVEPALTQALLADNPGAVRRMDALVEDRILSRDGVTRVKIWDEDATIIYSDEPRLIGSTFTLSAEDRATLEQGGTEAERTDLSRPENRFERGTGELLEVYLPIHAPNGDPLLFETYIQSSSVASASQRVWSTLAPVLIGALLLLAVLQLPLAASLARRLRSGQQEREELLTRAIDASEMERRRIAQDLHDGVVQDLAGVSYSVAAAAQRAGGDAQAADGDFLRQTAGRLRRSVRDLRGLLVEIYPPDLHRAGLAAALSDVAAGLESRGIEIVLDISDDLALPAELETLFFRVAQEALRNVVAHSGAATVKIRAATTDGVARLEVEDDGTGFSPDLESERGGHFGLRMLSDLARDAGARLTIDSRPGHGTRIRVEVDQ
jgi:two-component system, NarL family, sensor kinase